MTAILWVFSGLLGLSIGSFLNVLIYRIPKDESVVAPASHCPACGRPLRWWMNVPVVSFLALRGRCGFCGVPISPRYAAVELVTGGLFLAAAARTGLRWELLVDFAAVSAIVAVSFIDLEHKIIPNRIIYPMLVVVPAALGVVSPRIAIQSVFWGIGAAAFLFALSLIWAGGMGMGDVKLAGLVGFWLGPPVIVALFVAFVAGSAVGVTLMALGWRTRKDAVPFGPFIGLGAVVAYLAGAEIISLYLGLLSR